jgi:hypothetical protein
MYQPWSTGRHLLQKFMFKNINYQCAFQVQKDEGSWLWWNWICTGDCFANPPAIVIDPQSQGIAFSGTDFGKTPEQYVREQMIKINLLLTTYYGGIIPVTFGEKVEQLLQQMNVSTVSGIPQFVLDTEREWGNDVARNKWMAAETGYTGPFRDGLFGAWCTVNGWDPVALNAKYDAL